MLTKYTIKLRSNGGYEVTSEMAYRLYAMLLSKAAPEFGEYVHQCDTTPVSQSLTIDEDMEEIYWNVSFLNDTAIQQLSPILDDMTLCYLNGGVSFDIVDKKVETIDSVEDLLEQCKDWKKIRLTFDTPTAFKSHGQYVNIPTPELIVHSLIKSWNGCILECSIEDEDGEGEKSIAGGLEFEHFRLFDAAYRLKKNRIPGFKGAIIIHNHLTGFHSELVGALLKYASFSGIGIKTTLGMGSVRVEKIL